MKIVYPLLLTLVLSLSLPAQTLLQTRTADMRPENYSITGDAILEAYDDGSLELRLSDDFTTPRGPDVRIYLGNGNTLDGAVEIVNLTTISHFSGGISLAVPDTVALEDYDRLLMFCVQFDLFWASGTFDAPVTVGGGPDYTCMETDVVVVGGQDSVSVCATDGQAAFVDLANSRDEAAGEHYAYLVTDTDEVLQAVVTAGSFDFAGSGEETQRIYGINYDGDLAPMLGADRGQTTASGCFTHSSDAAFITVTKDGCALAYECRESLVATYDWVTTVNLCTTDEAIDTVFMKNNINVAPGEHYAFLLTDTNEIVQEVITTDRYDFNGTGTETQRVYGVNFDGELLPVIGQHRDNTMATGCAVHSGDDVFITVDKTAACATSTVDRALAGAVKVYPNPAAGMLTVDLPQGFKATEVSLLSLLGQTVFSRQIPGGSESLRLDIGGLPAGRYLLQLADGERLVAKVVTVR